MALSNPHRYEALLALALFFFVFLENSSFFCLGINNFGLDLGLATQIPSLTASGIGFLSFSFIINRTTKTARRLISTMGGIVGFLCIAGTLIVDNPYVIELFKVVAFYLLGFVGAGIHSLVSKFFAQSDHLCLFVALAYALGLSLQFLTYTFVPFGILKAILLAGATSLLVFFAYHAWHIVRPYSVREIRVLQETSTPHKNKNVTHPSSTLRYGGNFNQTVTQDLVRKYAPQKQPIKLALYLVALMALFSLLFNSLYGLSSFSSQSYSPFIPLPPRLVMAISGIIAGLLFDLKFSRYAGLIMIIMGLIATATILGVEGGMDPHLGSTVFFIANGFFVVFYTSSFLSLAPQMDNPDFWAGMGRTVANFCAIPATIPAVIFLESGNALALLSIIFPLFAVILFFSVKTGLLNFHHHAADGGYVFDSTGINQTVTPNNTSNEGERSPDHTLATSNIEAFEAKKSAKQSFFNPEAALLTHEEKVEQFAAHYELTPRETEILSAVTSGEQTLKHTASNLGISLRTVQHHLTSIYKKTNTQTRAGLTKRFIENDLQPKNEHNEKEQG